MKSIINKTVSFLLVLTFIFTMLPFNVFAAETNNTSIGANAEISQVGATYTPYFEYTNIITISKTTPVANASNNQLHIYVNNGSTKVNAYCIEPKTHLNTSDSLTPNKSKTWDNLEDDVQNAINTALAFGLEGNAARIREIVADTSEDTGISSVSVNHMYVATQVIIWELVLGHRYATYPFEINSKKGDLIYTFCGEGNNKEIKVAYDAIVSEMSTFQSVPSFAGFKKSLSKEYTLKATRKGDSWSYNAIKMHDSNKVLSHFDFSGIYDVGNAKVKITQESNHINIDIVDGSINESATPNEIIISSSKKDTAFPDTASSNAKIITYDAGGQQDTVTGYEIGKLDPPSAYIKLSVKTTSILKDATIRKELQTKNEFEESVEYGEGVLQQSKFVEGWYFYVKAPANKYSNFDTFILGPTDSQGYTQSLSEYIKENVDEKFTYEVPYGQYEVYELGMLKEGEDGSDIINDYYFPDNIIPSGEIYAGISKYPNVSPVVFVINENSHSDNYILHAENIIDIPFKFRKVFRDLDSSGEYVETYDKNYYFTATNKETNEVYLLRSKSDGSTHVVNTSSSDTTLYLPEGTYILHEFGKPVGGGTSTSLNPNDYYIPDNMIAPADVEVTISAEEYLKALEQGKDAIEVTFANTYTFPIKITKTDADTGEFLAGAVFGIYADEACTKELERITTGSDGIGYSATEYISGVYFAKEISPALNADGTSYYQPHTAVQILLCRNGGQEFGYINAKIKNEKYPSSIEITKVDGETQKPLEGAVFALYETYANAQKEEKGLEKLTTNSNGKAITSNKYKPGTYYYKELVAPYGYVRDTNIYSVTINKVTSDNVVVKVTRTNNVIKSKAGLEKYDGEGNPLKGAEFAFYSDKSCTPPYLLESNLISDADGYVLTKEQYAPGTYYFLETKAPDGYKPSTERFKVLIEYTDNKDAIFMAEKNAINTLTGSYLAIKKYDMFYGNNLNVVMGVYRNSECTDLATEINVVQGYGKTEDKLLPGTYYVKEIETDFGYNLSSQVITTTIPETNKEDNVITVTYANTPYSQTLSIEKTNENNGALLKGAQFEVRRPYENLIDTYLLQEGISSVAWVKGSDSTATFTASVSDTYGTNASYSGFDYGAIMLDVTSSDNSKEAYIYQDVYPKTLSDSLTAGQKYRFSAKVRCDSFLTIYNEEDYGAQLKVIFYYKDGTSSEEILSEPLKSQILGYYATKNNGFGEIETDFTIPENLSHLRLVMSVKNVTGKFYFDDIKLNSLEYSNWSLATSTFATTTWEKVPDEGMYNDEALKLTLKNPTNTSAFSVAATHRINISDLKPSTNYTLSCYVRVDDITKNNASATAYGIQLRGQFAGGATQTSNYISSTTSKDFNNGYIPLSIDILTPSTISSSTQFVVYIVAYNCTGTFYFDNARLYENHKLDSFDLYKKLAWGSSGSVTFTNKVSTEESLIGSNSLKINTTACTSSKRARVYRDIYGLVPGETYIISAYAKVTDITPVEGQSTYGAVIAGTIFDTSGGTKDNYSSYISEVTNTQINNGFQRLSLKVKIPDNYNYLRLNLAFRGATGTVYFDEVKVESANMVLGTLTTDSNGYASMSGIHLGEYEVAEISAPEGYKLNPESRLVNVYLQNSKFDTFLGFTNKPMDRTISLSKFDKRVVSYAKKYLEGATYELYAIPVATSSHYRAYATTNKNGPVTFLAAGTTEPFYVSTGSTYYLRESKAPEGYMLDKNWYLLTVTEDSCVISTYTDNNQNNEAIVAADGDKILGYNNSYSGSISLTKRYSDVPDNYAVAVFQLYNAETDELIYLDYNYNWNGDFVGMTQFNLYRNEKRTLGGLPPGKYYLLEVSTNGEGFFPMGTKIPFEMVIDEENQKCIDLEIVINNNKVLLPMAGGEGRTSVSPLAMIVVATIFCGTCTVIAVCPKRLIPCRASSKRKSYKIKKNL